MRLRQLILYLQQSHKYGSDNFNGIVIKANSIIIMMMMMMMKIKMRMAITTVAAESYCWNQTIARLTAANPCHQLQPLDPINYICQIYQHI